MKASKQSQTKSQSRRTIRHMTATARRGHGEGSVYRDAANGTWVGAISLGWRPDGSRIRRKVTGRTKTEVREKLKKLQAEADAGLKTSASYTRGQGRGRLGRRGAGRAGGQNCPVACGPAPAGDDADREHPAAGPDRAGRPAHAEQAGPDAVDQDDGQHAQRAGTGYPARRGQRSRGPERGSLRQAAAGQDRAPVPGDDRGRGGRAARRGQGPPSSRRLRDPLPDHRDPDRRGPGAAVGSRRPGRRPGCADAGAAEHRGVAVGPIAW